jgi:hypothetical protein
MLASITVENLKLIQMKLEEMSIEFIDANGEGVGVRYKFQ